MARLTTITDYFLICSAESRPQGKAIRENISAVLDRFGEKPLGVEGKEALTWVLMDYNDLIVHIFMEETRAFYALDRLWGDAPRLEVGAELRELKKGRLAKGFKRVGDVRS